MTLLQHDLPADTRQALKEAVLGAVDPFDAAARLESEGLGDAIARRAGYHNTFDHAAALLSERPSVTPTMISQPIRSNVVAAVARAVLMLAGVGISLTLVRSGTAGMVTFLAGGTAWLSAQTVSAAIWWGLGHSEESIGARWALHIAALLVGGSIALFSMLGHPEMAGWAVWGASAGVWLALERLPRVLFATLVGLFVALLGLLLPGARSDHIPGLVVICLVGLAAFWRLYTAARRRSDNTATGLRLAVLLAAAQAIAPILMLYLAARALGPEFLVVALGSMVAAAASEPLVDLASTQVRRIADRGVAWRSVRMQTAWLGVAVTVAAALFGLAAGVVTSLTMRGIVPGVQAIGITLAFSTFAVGGALLLRAGDSVAATVLAAVSSLSIALVVLGDQYLHATPLFAYLVLGSVAAVSAMAATRLSSPQAW